jgi:NADH:ubiquinone oxidoreductase subunit E
MEHEIVICLGSSCFARGNREQLLLIERYLAEHGLTDTVVLSGSRCEEQCSTGPNIRIDGQLHVAIAGEGLLDLLNRHLPK